MGREVEEEEKFFKSLGKSLHWAPHPLNSSLLTRHFSARPRFFLGSVSVSSNLWKSSPITLKKDADRTAAPGRERLHLIASLLAAGPAPHTHALSTFLESRGFRGHATWHPFRPDDRDYQPTQTTSDWAGDRGYAPPVHRR